MSTVGAIILAAGTGQRMKSPTPKQFLPLLGKPVFLYSLKAFDVVSDRLVLVTGKSWFDWCRERIREEGLAHEVILAEGGETRYASSLAGVNAAGDCDYLMIHDAARACVSREIIEASLQSAREKGSGIASVPLKDTIKQADADGKILSTPDRSHYRIIQTPQTFAGELILPAFRKMERLLETSEGRETLKDVTDDAMLAERLTGREVYLSPGSYENIKLTTPEDMLLAEAFLSRRQ